MTAVRVQTPSVGARPRPQGHPAKPASQVIKPSPGQATKPKAESSDPLGKIAMASAESKTESDMPNSVQSPTRAKRKRAKGNAEVKSGDQPAPSAKPEVTAASLQTGLKKSRTGLIQSKFPDLAIASDAVLRKGSDTTTSSLELDPNNCGDLWSQDAVNFNGNSIRGGVTGEKQSARGMPNVTCIHFHTWSKEIFNILNCKNPCFFY